MESDKPQVDKEERKGLIYALENFSFKKVFKYNLLILVVFLFIIGILSVFVLSDEAYKLVGGNRYNELVRDSGKNIKFSVFEKIKYLFSDEETKEKMIAEKLGENVSNREEDGFNGENKGLDGGSAKTESAYNKDGRYMVGGGNIPYKPKESISANLGNPSGYFSGGVSNTSLSMNLSASSISSFKGVGSGTVKIKNMDSKYSFSKPVEKNSNSALDMLKNTYKTTLYAARDASNDTARHWTAKAFEGAANIKATIQYDEKLRSKIDRINPNSIPYYLKDEGMDPKYNSLKPSDVPNPIAKKDDKASETSKEEVKKMIEDMASGVIPKATSGSGSGESNSDSISTLNRPSRIDEFINSNGLAELYSHSDDYGNYTVYKGSKDGYIYLKVTNDHSGPNGTGLPDNSFQVYDPSTNQIAYCVVPGQGMLMPGEGACAGPDMIWQWDKGYEHFANLYSKR
jgi:hypothetical protein